MNSQFLSPNSLHHIYLIIILRSFLLAARYTYIPYPPLHKRPSRLSILVRCIRYMLKPSKLEAFLFSPPSSGGYPFLHRSRRHAKWMNQTICHRTNDKQACTSHQVTGSPDWVWKMTRRGTFQATVVKWNLGCADHGIANTRNVPLAMMVAENCRVTHVWKCSSNMFYETRLGIYSDETHRCLDVNKGWIV